MKIYYTFRFSVLLFFIFFFLFNKTITAQWEFVGGSFPSGNVFFVDSLTAWSVNGYSTVLKSTNGGYDFEEQTTGITGSFNDIYFVDKNNGWIVGDTIIHTTDGGLNWIPQSNPLAEKLTNIKAFNNSIAIAYNQTNIIKTNDAGNHWNIYNIPKNLISISTSDTSSIWGITADSIYKTTNSGLIWTAIANPDTQNNLFLISFYNKMHGVILAHTPSSYGNNYYLTDYYTTTDGGNSWNINIFDNNDDYYNNLRDFKFSNKGLGWAIIDGQSNYGAHGGPPYTILTSLVNFGQSKGGGFYPLYGDYFYRIITAFNENIWIYADDGVEKFSTSSYNVEYLTGGINGDFHVLNDSTAIFVQNASYGDYHENYFATKRTTNFGKTWFLDNVFNNDWDVSIILSQFIDDSTGWLMATEGVLLSTVNGGLSWGFEYPTYSGLSSFDVSSMFFLNGYDGWVSQNSIIYRSTDGGPRWNEISSGYTFNSMCFTSEDKGFALVEQDSILKGTTDGGVSWFNQNINNSNHNILFKISFVDSSLGFILSQNGLIFRTTDGGNSWLKKYTSISNDLSFISFVNENDGWVAGTNQISYTHDGGETWKLDTTYSGNSITDMSFTSSNNGYVLTGGSLIRYHNTVPVPVELVSFNGNYNKTENSVELNWITATELSNYGYDVERKSNGSWETIGFVKGNGNSTSNKYYSFNDNNISNLKTIEYRLKQIDLDGNYKYSKTIEVNIKNLPTEFSLGQNYPNPFNPSTIIKYSIPSSSVEMRLVQLKVYDILGNEIATLVNEKKSPGNYEIRFDGSNIASGIYFYKLTTQDFVSVKKMLLLK